MWDEWRPSLQAPLWARGPMNLDLVWATLALIGAVLFGVVIIVWVDRWRKRSVADFQAPGDELNHYRALFDQGLLSSAEYDRIRSRLECGRVVKTAASAASGAPAVESVPSLQNAPPENQKENPAGLT